MWRIVADFQPEVFMRETVDKYYSISWPFNNSCEAKTLSDQISGQFIMMYTSQRHNPHQSTVNSQSWKAYILFPKWREHWVN